MPQAHMWERCSQYIEVALYVRRLAEAEKPEAFVNLGTLVRQMADSLGLTMPGMRSNRWRIDRPTDEDEAPAEPSAAPVIAPDSARARLRAVSGGSG
jgi:hypothetical protein